MESNHRMIELASFAALQVELMEFSWRANVAINQMIMVAERSIPEASIITISVCSQQRKTERRGLMGCTVNVMDSIHMKVSVVPTSMSWKSTVNR